MNKKLRFFSVAQQRIFSRNCCSITNKKLMKCTSRPAIRQCECWAHFSFLSTVLNSQKGFCLSNSKRTNKPDSYFTNSVVHRKKFSNIFLPEKTFVIFL